MICIVESSRTWEKGMKEYKTIQVDASIKDRLKILCDREGYSISFVANRLFERFLNGEAPHHEVFFKMHP